MSNQISASRASGDINSTELNKSYITEEKPFSLQEEVELLMELKGEILEIVAQNTTNHATKSSVTSTNIKSHTPQLGRAGDILSSAIASGIWTENNAKDFSSSLRSLSGEDIAEAHRRLSIAINNGDIEVAAGVILY